MARHIWTGAIQLPDGTLAEVLVNVYAPPHRHGDDPTTLDVALRADTWATWGIPAVLAYEGTDPPTPVAGREDAAPNYSQPFGLGDKEGEQDGEQDGKQGGVHPDRTGQVAEGPDGRGLHVGSGVLDRSGSDPQRQLADGAGRGLTSAALGGRVAPPGVAGREDAASSAGGA